MMRSYPPDVLVLDRDALLHARFGKGKKDPLLLQAKSYRIGDGAFSDAVVTPELANDAALAETLRRMRLETGKWDKASLLLPDSWFRINILELQALPEKKHEADEIIRWSLKRTMPIEPSTLRLTYDVLSRTTTQVRLLVVSAVDKTLSSLEKLFAANGVNIVLIEPIGLNVWNAITVHEPATTRDRVLFYFRERDFTTAAFRGPQPLFIRSRNLSGERTLDQEIRLSASYLRDTLGAVAVENCFVAGNRVDPTLAEAIGSEFKAPVRTLELRDVAEQTPAGIEAYEAELAACTGVFAG